MYRHMVGGVILSLNNPFLIILSHDQLALVAFSNDMFETQIFVVKKISSLLTALSAIASPTAI